MPTKRLKTQPAVLALAVAAFAATTDATSGATSYALPVLPAGSASQPVDNRFDGRSLLHDNAAIAAAFNTKGRKAAVDIGHLTEWDGAAPAFGWVMSLFVAEDGSLWANCDLTADGLALVEGKKFGYTSPTLRGTFVETGDWMALSLKSLALTNNPALEMSSTFTAEGEDETDEDEAPAVAADATSAEPVAEAEATPAVEETTSLAAQPAAETIALADFTALQATVTTLTAERDAAAAQVVTLTAQAAELNAQVLSLTTERDSARAELASFTEQADTAAMAAAIDEATVAGRVAPFEREVMETYGKQHGLTKLKEHMAARAKPAAFGGSSASNNPASDVPADVRAYLESMGLSVTAYVAGRS